MPAVTTALLLLAWVVALKAPADKRLVVPGLVVLLVAATHLVFRGWHVEDAGIVYAYAVSIAGGQGLSPAAGLAPVEGFSDPLWVALLAPASALGLPVPLAAKLLQVVLSALSCGAVVRLAERVGAAPRDAWLAALATCSAGAWAVWSTGGLEVALFGTLLVAAALAGAARRDAWVVLVVAACALTRPEGAVSGLACAAAGAASAGHGLRLGAPLLGAAVGLGAGLGARWLLLHTWLPNTALAKLGGPFGKKMLGGAAYAVLASLQLGLPWLWLAGQRDPDSPRRPHLLLSLSVLMLVALGLAVVVGGDWMRHSRFLAPWVPVLSALMVPPALRAARQTSTARALFTVGIGSGVLVFAHAVAHPTLPLDHGVRKGAVYAAITESSCAEQSVATPDIGGVLSTQPQLAVTDLVGLVDAEAAVHKREPHYWRQRLQAHPPSIVDLHSRWSERTGLTDEVLAELGYGVLCRRGQDSAAPTLWLHERCVLPLDGRAQALLDRWCESGSGVPWPEIGR